ncbi:unnamed protein product [Bubo scandiacus]
MEVKSLYEVARGTLITFGIISIFFSEFLLFSPVFSYKPWFFRWTVCLASPIWNGDLWEASFAFGILSIMGTSVQFVSAIASLLLCSYYCSLARIAVTNYLSYTVLFPFPYTDFPNLCKGLSRYKWYNLTLQILDLCSSLAIFCTSLGFGYEQDTQTQTASSEAGPEEAVWMHANLTMGFHLTSADLSVEIKYETVVASIVCILGVALN